MSLVFGDELIGPACSVGRLAGMSMIHFKLSRTQGFEMTIQQGEFLAWLHSLSAAGKTLINLV